MKIKFKRAFSVLLAIIQILLLAACGGAGGTETPKPTDPITPPAQETPSIDVTKYTVVYSNKLTSKTAEAATDLATDLTGSGFSARIDVISDPEEYEILIGQTNRPESADALALLTNDTTFIIKVIGSKIVVNAHNEGILITAITYFTDMITKTTLTSEFEYVSDPVTKLTVAKDGKTNFSLVYMTGLLTSGGTEGKCELELQLCREIRDALTSTYAATPEIVEDKVEGKYEILVGETARAESDTFISSLAYNEYGFGVIGDKIVIAGTNATSTRLAAELFTKTLQHLGETEGQSFNAYLYNGMRFTKRNDKLNADIPEYEGGEFAGAHDGGNGALTLAYGNTTAAAFEEYCKKLESEGYVLWQRNDIERNRHATYTHETRGMIHTYFTASEETVRIVSYHDGKYNLPENKEPINYENLTATAITGYGISAGMCYAITLADSSFIIIDGGSGDSAETFYKFLQSQNKRPDGKIIIRAWYLTHEHSDHYTMTKAFLKKYGKKVTIEEFWCNPVTVDYSHYGDNRNVMWEESYKTYKDYINGDFKWMTLHTGMEFYVANLKFEVLFTEEDIFPRRCYSFNDCDLIMKMTETISGQTVLWTGDLVRRGCEIITNNYSEYLKCDIIQVPHHGMSEAIPLYKEARPSVALWPSTDAKMEKNKYVSGGIYVDSFDYLKNNVLTHLVANSNYTVTLPFKNGDPVTIWKTIN